MRNLWDRLKPEIKAELQKEYENHPNLFEASKGELSKEFYYTNVRYYTYKELYFANFKASGGHEHDLKEYFLPE